MPYPKMKYHEDGLRQVKCVSPQHEAQLGEQWGDNPVMPRLKVATTCPGCVQLEAQLDRLKSLAQKKINEQRREIEDLIKVNAELAEDNAAKAEKLKPKKDRKVAA
jgi:hypothetical protein